MFVAFMLKHTVLVECRATLFEVEFKFHLNLINFQSLKIGKDFLLKFFFFLPFQPNS